MIPFELRKQLDKKGILEAKEIGKAAAVLDSKVQCYDDEKMYEVYEKAFWKTILRSSNRLHIIMDDLALSEPLVEQDKIFSQLAGVEHIQAKAVNGMLLVCCPHPPKRKNDYFKEYRYPLNYAIGKIASQLDLYPEKEIYLLNVYQPNRKYAVRILDFDNYDMKNLIDEACRLYPKTDSPLHTSMHLYTTISDELDPLTYLVITPARWNGDLMNLLIGAFGTSSAKQPDTPEEKD
jgi:hypothetical protein